MSSSCYVFLSSISLSSLCWSRSVIQSFFLTFLSGIWLEVLLMGFDCWILRKSIVRISNKNPSQLWRSQQKERMEKNFKWILVFNLFICFFSTRLKFILGQIQGEHDTTNMNCTRKLTNLLVLCFVARVC